MWKFLFESVDGTSHRRSGTSCQDASFATPFSFAHDDGLILVCSDGAGSASASAVGSALACSVVAREAMQFIEGGRGVGELSQEVVTSWFRVANASLKEEAARLERLPRELACTLLVGVVGRASAAFAQIGDGAIVVLDDDGTYRHVFWPQTGEYHNTTFFLTDDGFEQNIQCETVTRNVAELGLMTDGLQMLALNYATRSVHQRFFADLFRSLRAVANHVDLVVPMRQWLDSDAVNGRTDDDKTLVLATRVGQGGDVAV